MQTTKRLKMWEMDKFMFILSAWRQNILDEPLKEVFGSTWIMFKNSMTNFEYPYLYWLVHTCLIKTQPFAHIDTDTLNDFGKILVLLKSEGDTRILSAQTLLSISVILDK